MKSWFVYEIHGERIGFWGNNTDEAEEHIRENFGDVEFRFLGIDYGIFGPKPERCVYDGMTGIEAVMLSGLLRAFEA